MVYDRLRELSGGIVLRSARKALTQHNCSADACVFLVLFWQFERLCQCIWAVF